MRTPSVLLTYALFFATASAIHAQTTIPKTDIPRTISYQGVLTHNDGTPFIDGQYQVTVGLYGDEQGGRLVWKETYATQVKGGVFTIYLGSGGQALPDAKVLDGPLWIGTAVNGGVEMRPLTPLSASPYALNVPDNAITAQKVDMDYISEIRIDGEKISGKGTVLNLMGTPGVPLHYDEATQSVTIGKAAVQTGDREKGAGILAAQDQVWSANGDGWDIAGGVAYTPVAGDWLGTSTGVDLVLKVNSQQVVQYQQTGTSIPNIIGGQGNGITAATTLGSIIAEGTSNTISNGNYNVIGGGELNSVGNANYSSVGGGHSNAVTADRAFIGGGHGNSISGFLSFIGGGINNSITATPSGNVVAGGSSNRILGTSASSIIGAGSLNTIDDASYAFLGGGWFNSIEDSTQSSISGGSNNHIVKSHYSTIGAGFYNIIELSDYSTIGGGDENRIVTAGTKYSTIGGGRGNAVQSSYGTIPGGDQLLVNTSYAQTAVGFFNAPRGTMAVRPSAATIAASDNPLFMVGNGSIIGGTRSNAFEVSYNGHSVVYGKLGNSPGPSAIEGATYADNVVYGWGEINGIGGIISGFGVGAVGHVLGTGVYTITLNLVDPTGVALAFTNLAVTATLNDNSCAFINVIRNAAPANTFTVNIHNASCLPVDLPFTFHVTGRR